MTTTIVSYMDPLSSLLLLILIFILSSIPLYLAVKLLGGKTTILKTAFVSFIAGIIVSLINLFIQVIGGIIAFIVLIWIYKSMFSMGWIRAFLAWFLQFIIIGVIIFVLSLLGFQIFNSIF